MTSPYFPIHAHSEFSALDGMGDVATMVSTVAGMGQQGLALTDHGNMAGSIRLYKECRKHDLRPFPGSEFYLVRDVNHKEWREQRFHLGMMALDAVGFRALTALSSRSHLRERFHRKPLIDLNDLSELGHSFGKHIAVTTGCYFGWVIQNMLAGERDQWGDLGKITIRGLLQMGFEHVFVEMQDHGILHDEEADIYDEDVALVLFEIAQDMGLPVVIGQDSHYCDLDQKHAHDMMKDIAYMGGENEDNRFPGDAFHLATTDWLRRFQWSDAQWDAAMAGHQELLDLHDLVLPELDNYKFAVPEVSKRPDDELQEMVEEAFAQFDMWGDMTYSDRIDTELSVIKQKGMAGYFLMMADLMGWCRDEGIFIDARGSANGSLVCYLLEITNVDPIEWDTDFDRFLSLDRDKPPDIDMDIESDRRDDVIEYLRSRFPSMVQIGTWSRLGISKEDPSKGSIFVQYHAAMRRKPDYNGRVKDEHIGPLLDLSVMDVRKGPGAHAAGFVIPGKGLSVDDYLATMLIPKGKGGNTVTQAPMGDVEDAGYMKCDLLGQQSLTTMRRTVEAIGKDPVADGMDWIPDNDRKACVILQSGQVGNGVFQFEGFSTAKGARKMGIKNTEDAVIALALFRPAMMDSGMTDEYLAARRAKQRQTIHPTVDDLFDKTWGVPVFQEQVLGLMKRVGLPADDRNAILKAVKASNDKIAEYATATFDRVYPLFIASAQETLGVDEEDAETMWATVMKFTDYGFNRAHAVAYGLRAYRTAYLKTHYTTEYMAALLSTWAGTEKEPLYISEARRLKMQIRKPDVNGSDVTWTIDRPMVLRKGLLTIKGVGEVAARAIIEEREQNGDFTDIDDLCARVPAKQLTGAAAWKKDKTFKGVLSILRDADALRSLGVDS